MSIRSNRKWKAWALWRPHLVDHRHYNTQAVSGISSSQAVYYKRNPLLLCRNAYQEPLDEPCIRAEVYFSSELHKKVSFKWGRGGGVRVAKIVWFATLVRSMQWSWPSAQITDLRLHKYNLSLTSSGCRFFSVSLTATCWSGGIVQLLFHGSKFYISFIYVVLGLKPNSPGFEKKDLSRRTKGLLLGLIHQSNKLLSDTV